MKCMVTRFDDHTYPLVEVGVGVAHRVTVSRHTVHPRDEARVVIKDLLACFGIGVTEKLSPDAMRSAVERACTLVGVDMVTRLSIPFGPSAAGAAQARHAAHVKEKTAQKYERRAVLARRARKRGRR